MSKLVQDFLNDSLAIILQNCLNSCEYKLKNNNYCFIK